MYVRVSSDQNNWFTPLQNNEQVVWTAGPQDPLYWKIQLPPGVSVSFYIGIATVPHAPARPLPRA
jgi:hypothetical protein